MTGEGPFDTAPALRALARRDRALKNAIKTIGEPHIRRRPGGFEGLFRIIVEQFRFDALDALSDDAAMAKLCALRGVGPWTASIYLLFCDGRVDLWPPADVALRAAYCAAARNDIDQKSLDAGAAAWSPWRGVAAHVLWTYYAKIRGRTPI